MADPYCLAMVLCDAVHRDVSTHKFTLLGTFSNISAQSFPAQIRLAVYFAITDGIGPNTLRLQIVNASGGIVDACNEEVDPARVFLVKAEVNFENPLIVLESVFSFEVPIPEAGLYHCELWANNTVLMSRRITATLIPQSPPQAPEEE